MRLKGGRLVVFEGIDGSGKSTLLAHVSARLAEAGIDATTTREPTDTWLGTAVRKSIDSDADAVSEALLFMADHANHVRWVRGELAKDKLVVSDRWNDSCLAYQGATLAAAWERPPEEAIAYLEAVARPFDLAPHLVVWIDVPPETAVARLAARTKQAKYERAQFLAQVRANYALLAERRGNYVRVDGARPLHEVEAQALAAITRVVGRPLGGSA